MKDAQVVLHRHGEPAELVSVSLAQGDVDQDVDFPRGEVGETVRPVVSPSPGGGDRDGRFDAAPLADDAASFGQPRKGGLFGQVGTMLAVVDSYLVRPYVQLFDENAAHLRHHRAPRVLTSDVVGLDRYHHVAPGLARRLEEDRLPRVPHLLFTGQGHGHPVHVLVHCPGDHESLLVGPGANGHDLAGHPGVVHPHHPEPIDIRVGATALADAGSRFREEEMRGNPENSGSGDRGL